MTWLSGTSDENEEFRAVLGLRPEVLARHEDLVSRIWRDGGPDPQVLEMCRLRIAQLHASTYDAALRSEPAVSAGLTEDKINELGLYSSSPLYSEHERRALAFAEHYVMDVHGITDEVFAAVAEGMTSAQMAAFTFALGIFDGLTRFRVMLGVRPNPGTAQLIPPDVAASL